MYGPDDSLKGVSLKSSWSLGFAFPLILILGISSTRCCAIPRGTSLLKLRLAYKTLWERQGRNSERLTLG